MSELIFFRATNSARPGSRSATSGPALGARRSPAEVIPSETMDGLAQLDSLLRPAPHLQEVVRRVVSVPVGLPHRFVRSSAYKRREELSRAVTAWAPDVNVVLGPPVDFRPPRLLGPLVRDSIAGVQNSLRDSE